MSKHNSGIALAVLILSAVVMLSSCTKEAAEQKGQGDGVPWLSSMDEALQQAGKKNQPIMIDVYADWCVWCRRPTS